MKNGEFTIKEISELLGQTRGAIRFYEEKGLIHPRRDHNDFRYYSLDDLFQLFYLKRYASLSLSLDEVGSYFRRESSCSLDEIQSMLQGKQTDLDSEIERLQRIKISLQSCSRSVNY